MIDNDLPALFAADTADKGSFRKIAWSSEKSIVNLTISETDVVYNKNGCQLII